MNLQRDVVKTYYGETLQTSSDLKTDACSTLAAPARHVIDAIGAVHPDVAAKYYGCGLVVPPVLEGLNVLDLGCGAGRDVYVLSRLVGEGGFVTGIDMTKEQLSVAEAHRDWHADAFGYGAPNTRFIEGYLENLEELEIEPGSIDLIVSNCVINLCTDKPAVFRAAHKFLKPGGELYFSDVYADRRIPNVLANDPVLYGECLSGALYWNDFMAIARANGFADPRTVEHRRLQIIDSAIRSVLEPIRFASVTARLIKLESLEPACEDYGQAVIYKGGIEGMENVFELDAEHQIEKGRVFPVCGNTMAMLTETRFSPYFETIGNGETHYGVFPGCAAPDVFADLVQPAALAPVGGCC